ncbi:MAG: metalloregulator ArsR/SmtB family transcription factor [Chloroflexi bacterium]|nr:metalloregulator ArsR/SmtB family transcription factor [Chloroflexota bacterium]
MFPSAAEITLLHNSICQALSEPRRILILYALHERPTHVTALAEQLDIPQPTVSRHLRVLRQQGLVQTERQGAAVVYTLTEPRLIEVLDLMRDILRDTLAHKMSVVA